MCEGQDLPLPRRPHEATLNSGTVLIILRLRPGAVAEPGPRVKHRLAIMRNDIAGTRISYKSQKLQAMSATVQSCCDSLCKLGLAGRKTWRHATVRS